MTAVDPTRLFLANWTSAPTMTVRWASVIEKADDRHEKRSSLVSRPYLSGRVLCSGIQTKNLDATTLLRLSAEMVKSQINLPLYNDFVKVLNAASIGATVISVSATSNLRFFVGQKVAVCRSDPVTRTQWAFEIKTLQAVSANTVTFTAGLSTAITAGCRIYPLVPCEVSSDATATLVTDQSAEMSFDYLQTVDPLGLPPLTTPGTLPPGFATFNGYPIFDLPFDWENIEAGYSRDLSITASGLGNSVTQYGTFTARTFQSNMSLFGRTQIGRMMSFFDSRAGMVFPFWLPMPIHSFKVSVMGPNVLVFDSPVAKPGDTDSLIGTHVCLWYRDGSKQVVRIGTRVTNSYFTVQTITNTDVSQLRRVSPCFLARFSSDSMSYSFIADDKIQTSIECVQIRTCNDSECVPTVPDLEATEGADLDSIWTPCECDPCEFDVTMRPYPCSSCEDDRIGLEAQRWTPPTIMVASFKDEFAPDLFHQCQECVLKQWQFPSLTGWTPVGPPIESGNKLRLTDHVYASEGTAWFDTPLTIEDDDKFEVQFRFSVRDIRRAGSEGFSLIFAADSTFGLQGGRLGYGGLDKCLAVEFDLRPDAEDGGLEGPHLSINTENAGTNTTDHASSLGSVLLNGMDDGKIHRVRVNYSKGFLRVYVDHLVIPKLTVQTSFFQDVTSVVNIGFGASNDEDGTSRIDLHCAAASVKFRSFRKAFNRMRGAWRLTYAGSEVQQSRHWHHVTILDSIPPPPGWGPPDSERIVHRWTRQKMYRDEDGVQRIIRAEARIEEPTEPSGAQTAVCHLHVFVPEMDLAWNEDDVSEGVTFNLDDPAVCGPFHGAAGFRHKVGHPHLFHTSCIPTSQEAPCPTTWFNKDIRTDGDDPYTSTRAQCFAATARLPWNKDPSTLDAYGVSLFQVSDPQADYHAAAIMLGGDCPKSELFEWLTIEDFPGVSGSTPSFSGWDSEVGGIVWKSSARLLACNPVQISDASCCEEVHGFECIKVTDPNECCFSNESVWTVNVFQQCRYNYVAFDAFGQPTDARYGVSQTYQVALKFFVSACTLQALAGQDPSLRSVQWECRLPNPDYVYRYWRGDLTGTMGDIEEWNVDNCNEYLSETRAKIINYTGPANGFCLLYLDKNPMGLDVFKDGRVAATVKTAAIAQGLGLRCANNFSTQGYVCVVDPVSTSAEIRKYLNDGFGNISYVILAHKYGITLNVGDRLEASVVGSRILFIGNGGSKFAIQADDCVWTEGRFGVVGIAGQVPTVETAPGPFYEMLEVDDYGPDLMTAFIHHQPGAGLVVSVGERFMPGYGLDSCDYCEGTCGGDDGCATPTVSCSYTSKYLIPRGIVSTQFPRITSNMVIPLGTPRPALCTSLPGNIDFVVLRGTLSNNSCDTEGDDAECLGFESWYSECIVSSE